MRTLLFVSLLLLAAHPGLAQETFTGPFAEPADGGNLDVARSTFDGTTVTLVPRAHASEALAGAYRWRNVYFALRGVQDRTPTFRLSLRSPVTLHHVHENDVTTFNHAKLVWSYQREGPWNDFTSHTRTGQFTTTRRIDAKNAAPFTQDVIYVSLAERAPVTAFHTWLEQTVFPHPFVRPTASEVSTGTFLIGLQAGAAAAGPSAPVSRQISDTPLHGFVIRDPARTPTKLVVLMSGQHPSEGLNKAALRAALAWIMDSPSPEAVAYRSQFVTLVYPFVNPTGELAGLWRGTAYDPSRDPDLNWDTPLQDPAADRGIDTVIAHKKALQTDIAALGLGEPFALFDYHQDILDGGSRNYLLRSSASTSSTVPARKVADSLGAAYYQRLNAATPLSDKKSDPANAKTLRGYAITRGVQLPFSFHRSVYNTVAMEEAFGRATVTALVDPAAAPPPEPALLPMNAIRWAFVGSSTTAGAHLDPVTDRYADRIATLRGWGAVGSGNAHEYFVAAIRAATYTELAAAAPSSVDAQLAPDRRNILLLQGGANDVKTQDVPTVLAATKAYCADRRAAGWEVYLILNTWPKHGGADPQDAVNHNARMPVLNAALLADPAFFDGTYASGIFRVDAEMVLKDSTRLAYWISDGLHLNSDGHGLFAALLDSELGALLDGDDSHPVVSWTTAPDEGAGVSGTVTLTGAATDSAGVTWAELWYGLPAQQGRAMHVFQIGARLTAPPFTWAWNTTSLPAGEARLFFRARDQSGNYAVTPPRRVVVAAAAQPPTITNHPASRTVAAGSPVTFSVTATGQAPLSYQWRKDGSPLGGATAATYQIAAVTAAHAGAYTVVVSNAAGTTTSNAATLALSSTAPGALLVFDDASGSGTLSGRVPATTYQGHAWGDLYQSSGTSPAAVVDGVIVADKGTRATVDAGHADADVSADVTFETADGGVGLLLRNVDANNRLRFTIDAAGWLLVAYKNSSSPTTLAKGTVAYAAHAVHGIRAVLQGSNVKLYVNGAQVGAAAGYTTTVGQSSTRHGISGVQGTSGLSRHTWDNITIRALGTPSP